VGTFPLQGLPLTPAAVTRGRAAALLELFAFLSATLILRTPPFSAPAPLRNTARPLHAAPRTPCVNPRRRHPPRPLLSLLYIDSLPCEAKVLSFFSWSALASYASFIYLKGRARLLRDCSPRPTPGSPLLGGERRRGSHARCCPLPQTRSPTKDLFPDAFLAPVTASTGLTPPLRVPGPPGPLEGPSYRGR
jgi:hypothetical protein